MPAEQTLSETIAEVRRLIAEAMLGPLHAGRSDMVSYVLDDDRPFKNIYGPASPPDDIARVWGERCIARAQLLALAANHLPALLDVAEAAAAYQEEMAALGNGVDPALSAALSALAPLDKE